jgi:hypothetical protein
MDCDPPSGTGRYSPGTGRIPVLTIQGRKVGMMAALRHETLREVQERLKQNADYGKSSYPSRLGIRWHRPVSFGTFLAGFAVLLVGLLLLTGFVFHEVGIVTPLDGLYTWLHTAFGGMEEHSVAGWMWRPQW